MPAVRGEFSLDDIALMGRFLTKPGFLLARIDQICTALFGQLTSRTTLNQAEFLLLLERLGPMIQISLARAAGVDKSTTALILDNLEARGWVLRRVNAGDRRSCIVELTADGAALAATLRPAFEGLQHLLEEPVEPAGRARLKALLRLLASQSDAPSPPWQSACEPLTGVLDNAPSFLTRRVLQLLQAQFQITARETGLTLRQFSLLFLLSQRETVTQSEFARLFGIDPATCGVIMRSAARRGLIRSVRSETDRRARLSSLTREGASLLREAHPLVDQSQALVFAAISAADQHEMIRQLRAIVLAHSHALRFPGAIGLAPAEA